MTETPDFPHTALKCLVAIARRRELDLSVERLVHDNALTDDEPSTAQLIRIAGDAGLKAKATRLRWSDLPKLREAYPVLARLKNGNSVVLAGFRGDGSEGQVFVLDPLSDRPGFIPLGKDELEKAWSGEVILLKRRYRLADETQPFGLRWFVPEIIRQRRLFSDVGVTAFVLHALALATPIFFQLVIDKVLVHKTFTTLYVLAVGIVIALVFDAVFTFLRRYILLYATNKIDIRVATRTFHHLLSLPVEFFERSAAGVLTKHMQQAQRVREFLTGKLFLTVLDATALCVFLPVLFLYNVKLTFIVLMFAALIAAIIGGLVGPFRRRLRELYQAEGERQALLVEAIHGMPTVKALAIEPQQGKKWDVRAAHAVSMHFRVGKISTVAQAATALFEKLMIVAVIGFGAQDVFDANMTVGALVAFQMLAGRVSGPLVQIVSLVHEYQEAALSVRMLGEIMNSRPESAGVAAGLRPALKGGIDFEAVTFRYDGTTVPALADITVNIPAGTIFGIVGRSGSGKTTLTRLIQGLYPIQEGVVRIDGYDVREFDLSHLRRSIGVVLQDSFLFRGTVRENIAMTKTDASFEEIVQAARRAGADEFIQYLPKGYDTQLEEHAANLSGGQKQRLAIARALLPEPRILILDEATSALDPESEAILQRNLADLAHGRTVIIVSHRLSMLRDARSILVLERGRLAGLGAHDDLLHSCFVYRQLWKQQAKHYQ